jgi:DnaJ-class molecular chaperone
MKAWQIVLIFAILVYGALYVYTFHLSPVVKEKSVENWVEKEKERKVSFVQSEVCRECHLKVYRTWISGNHSSVECEVCHGYGAEHVKLRTKESVIVEKSRDSCLICHKEIAGRTAIKVVDEGHGSGVICTYCHDPHR